MLLLLPVLLAQFDAAIVVGHSLFTRQLFRRYLSPAFTKRHPTLATRLTSEKLQNCGCVAVEIEFDGPHQPSFVNVELMFDTGFASPSPSVSRRGSLQSSPAVARRASLAPSAASKSPPAARRASRDIRDLEAAARGAADHPDADAAHRHESEMALALAEQLAAAAAIAQQSSEQPDQPSQQVSS